LLAILNNIFPILRFYVEIPSYELTPIMRILFKAHKIITLKKISKSLSGSKVIATG